jgi:hypothetical protein
MPERDQERRRLAVELSRLSKIVQRIEDVVRQHDAKLELARDRVLAIEAAIAALDARVAALEGQ